MQPCFQLSASANPAQPPTSCKTSVKANLPSVKLGKIQLDKPVILAPMAGVTNPPFRRLCNEYGATLTISEMLHASLYLSNKIKPTFNTQEIRSVQLYGTDADTLSAAAMRLVEEERIHHLDLNFGCPAPKILRRGGGAAVPGDTPRFERILKDVVGVCGGVPVTCKIRVGYGGRETYYEAGRIAEACGVSGITLHTRTAEEGYDRGVGRLGWYKIGELVSMLGIPVFGNGDVFSGDDAVDMVNMTGCAGVVVGRGCLGRPWLFKDIVEAFDGGCGVSAPSIGTVLRVMKGLVEEIVEYLMVRGMKERNAVMAVRKWYSWFLQGYDCGDLVDQLMTAVGIDGIGEIIDSFQGDVSIDICEVLKERGKLGRE